MFLPDWVFLTVCSVVTSLWLASTASAQTIRRAEAVTQPGSQVLENKEPASTIIDPDRQLQPGDQVAVVIEEDNDPAPTIKAVSAAGHLEISPLGSVKVAGLTATQASNAVKRFLEGEYYYKATVRLSVESVNLAASMGTIYLSGEVNGVGPQPIYAGRQLMLSQAILNAGGFRKFADSRKVKVTRMDRGNPRTHVVDVKEVIERGRTNEDMELQDGDRIFVPEAFFKH
jgi:polysaccharide biosynthesis/export protein